MPNIWVDFTKEVRSVLAEAGYSKQDLSATGLQFCSFLKMQNPKNYHELTEEQILSARKTWLPPLYSKQHARGHHWRGKERVDIGKLAEAPHRQVVVTTTEEKLMPQEEAEMLEMLRKLNETGKILQSIHKDLLEMQIMVAQNKLSIISDPIEVAEDDDYENAVADYE